MIQNFQISIIDQSGIEQALDFDYRHQNHKTLYNDVRSEIKKVFTEKIELINELFPKRNLTFKVNLEQEKKDALSETLASFDSGRSADDVYVFHIYYGTIRQIADSLLLGSSNAIFKSFSDTILHELIHAADLSILKESNTVREHSYRLHGLNSNQFLKDFNAPNYEWNVQWAMLRFFQIFRNEGIAMLGQHLFNVTCVLDIERPIEQVMNRFKDILVTVMSKCSGLKYYNNFESTKAHQILNELSLDAYRYGDLIFLELIRTIYPKECNLVADFISNLSVSSSNSFDKEQSIYLLKLTMEIDLSEYVQAVFNNEILNREEPLSKKQLLECCAIIQNDSQADLISAFSKNIGICGFNKSSTIFIQTISAVIGSKMTEIEIGENYHLFLQKHYPEDIVHVIRAMADKLLPYALNENNEVAIWALTYLFDDQDLIHDELAILGWQDDWMVLDAACRII